MEKRNSIFGNIESRFQKIHLSYHKFKSFILTKQRRYCCCQTKTWNYKRKISSHKSENMICSTYFDTKQLIFNSKVYLQIKGCAMGVICAPTYANNIFMSEFKDKCIYPFIKDKCSSYLRFIDNIFKVWTKLENQPKSFLNEINKNHHSIKSEFKFSKEKIEFLD